MEEKKDGKRKANRLNVTPKLKQLLDIKPEPSGGRARISGTSICRRIVDERGYLPAVADALGIRVEALAKAVRMDETLSAAMTAAEEIDIFEARRALREAVLGGDVQAIKFFLEHRDPDYATAISAPEQEDAQTLAAAMEQAEAAGYVVLAGAGADGLRDPPKKRKETK